MAVNIAEGNGYSNNINPPYERQFFREPGYPYFFSIACVINKAIGNTNTHLSYKVQQPGYYEGVHKEITILRIMQAFLASITVLVFYNILIVLLRPQIAILISFLFIFYVPFAIFITFPQREVMVTTLLMGMGLLFLRSAYSSNPLRYDILFGTLAVLLVLTLQVYFYILPIFLICHLVLTRDLRKTIRSSLVIGLVFLLGVAPWSYRGYLEADSFRAVKTFGVSYTYEFKKFHDVNARAYFENVNGKGEDYIAKIVEGYSEPGRTMFEKSFNGYYKQYADSLSNVIREQTSVRGFERIKDGAIRQITKFRKALIWPLWKPDYRKNISTLINEGKGQLMILLLSGGVVIAAFFVFGMVFFVSKIWPLIPVFVFHLITIPILAGEGRRVLPFIPFYFMFFILAIIYFLRPYGRDNIINKTKIHGV